MEVSVIGLGVMGAALARAFLRDGHRVTVWNRTSAKAEALVREGAILAASVASAVEASSVVVVCVDDYAATYELLDHANVAPLLEGRVLVQLSTGSPADARKAEAWARARRVDYLDGAIMATPSQMARPDTTIFVSGGEAVFRRVEALLRSLGGNVSHVGEEIGKASALDSAILCVLFGGILGFFHAALVSEAEGLRVDSVGDMVTAIAPVLGEMIKQTGAVIHSGAYENAESSVRICAKAFELFARHAREADINAEFPAFGLGLFRRALAAGHGEEDVAAVIKVLRS